MAYTAAPRGKKKKAFSKETYLFDDEEAKQILKTVRPFEFARIWERRAAALGKQEDLVVGRLESASVDS